MCNRTHTHTHTPSTQAPDKYTGTHTHRNTHTHTHPAALNTHPCFNTSQIKAWVSESFPSFHITVFRITTFYNPLIRLLLRSPCPTPKCACQTKWPSSITQTPQTHSRAAKPSTQDCLCKSQDAVCKSTTKHQPQLFTFNQIVYKQYKFQTLFQC